MENAVETKKLEEFLVEQNMINSEQFKEAVTLSEENNRSITDILIEKSVVTKDQIHWARSQILGMPFVDLMPGMIDQDLIESIPSGILRQYKVLPLIRVGDELTILTANPLKEEVKKDLTNVFGCKIELALTDENEIAKIMDEFLPSDIKIELDGKKDVDKATFFENIQLLDDSEDILKDDPGAVRLLGRVLEEAIDKNANEIHIELVGKEKMRFRFRESDTLRVIEEHPVYVLKNILNRIKLDADLGTNYLNEFVHRELFKKIKDVNYNLQIHFSPTYPYESVVIKLNETNKVPPELSSFDISKFDIKTMQNYLLRQKGLLIFADPSGETSNPLVYSMLSEMDLSYRKGFLIKQQKGGYKIDEMTNIITPESEKPFLNVLSNIKSQSPDFIVIENLQLQSAVVSEMLKVIHSGCLIIATTFVSGVDGFMDLIVSNEVDPVLLSHHLLAVMAMRDVALLCDNCKASESIDDFIMRRFGLEGMDKPVFRAVGCKKCQNSGYSGRKIAYDLFKISKRERKEILLKSRENKSFAKWGDGLMLDAAEMLYKGMTSIDEMHYLGF